MSRYKLRGVQDTIQETVEKALTPIQEFSDVSKDGKVNFSDLYIDTRTFLSKANSTKFIIVCFILILSPWLLYLGYLAEDTYREIVLWTTLSYMGVDVYENRKMIRK